MSKRAKPRALPPGPLYDAAPFPSRMSRPITDKQLHDWGLEEAAQKIPEGKVVMLYGKKKDDRS
jgi:hypothetical protein